MPTLIKCPVGSLPPYDRTDHEDLCSINGLLQVVLDVVHTLLQGEPLGQEELLGVSFIDEHLQEVQ